MTADEVNRYLKLAERKAFIVAHAGTSWQPEWGPELTAIDEELKMLRPLVDQEHAKRAEPEKSPTWSQSRKRLPEPVYHMIISESSAFRAA